MSDYGLALSHRKPSVRFTESESVRRQDKNTEFSSRNSCPSRISAGSALDCFPCCEFPGRKVVAVEARKIRPRGYKSHSSALTPVNPNDCSLKHFFKLLNKF